jgi:hypothetical protein
MDMGGDPNVAFSVFGAAGMALVAPHPAISTVSTADPMQAASILFVYAARVRTDFVSFIMVAKNPFFRYYNARKYRREVLAYSG